MTMRDNNFDLLRFISAIFVIITHSYVLLGIGMESDPLRKISNQVIPFSMVGLYTFFTISGFLITQSMENSRSNNSFLLKRFLRIFPALIALIVVSAFIVGPLLTKLSISDYFTSAETYIYLRNISMVNIVYRLPGVFEDFTIKAFNGPIYTLIYEFLFYISILLLSILGLLKNKWFRYIILGFLIPLKVLLLLKIFPITITTFPPYVDIRFDYMVDFGIFFFLGSIFTWKKNHLLFKNISLLIATAVMFLSFYFIPKPYSFMSVIICLPVIIFNLSFNKKLKFLNNFGKYGEFSYGIYLWGMPMQQIVIYWFSNNVAPIYYNILVISIVIPIGFLSWILIEKRALSLKKMIP